MAALDKSSDNPRTTVLFGPVDSATLMTMRNDKVDSPGINRIDAMRRFLGRAVDCDIQNYLGNNNTDCAIDPDTKTESNRTVNAVSQSDWIVAAIDDYLDTGLPQAAETALTRCLEGGESLAKCFDREQAQFADIRDSDEYWQQTMVALWSDWIVTTIHDYLDYGLPLNAETALVDCLEGGENLEECLGREVFTSIQDSDENWRQTMVDFLGQSESDWIVTAIHDYLDTGLPLDAETALVDCLEGGENLEECLDRDVFAAIQDSDENWRQTMVVRLSPSESNRIVAAIHDYLDTGLPQAAETALTRCLEGGESLARCLNRAAFADIQDSDENWRQTMVDVLSPSASEQEEAWTGQRERMHVVSTLATAPLDALFKNESAELRADDVSEAGGVDNAFARRLGVASFRSVVARDDLVLRDVLLELESRGACRKDNPTIAVVSEQDTVYGQILDDVMTSIIGDGHKCEFQVEEYGYLRGVDGELPPQSQTMGTSRDATADAISADRTTGGERAFGPHQLDYARRFADAIGREIESNDQRDLVAIGILGSDVYDKLLILRSLRERLPWITYFTTDLDARLLDADSDTSTRNLIVGSAYGFTTGDRIGAGFRDSYQTALHPRCDARIGAGIRGQRRWHRRWSDGPDPTGLRDWSLQGRGHHEMSGAFTSVSRDVGGARHSSRCHVQPTLMASDGGGGLAPVAAPWSRDRRRCDAPGFEQEDMCRAPECARHGGDHRWRIGHRAVGGDRLLGEARC